MSDPDLRAIARHITGKKPGNSALPQGVQPQFTRGVVTAYDATTGQVTVKLGGSTVTVVADCLTSALVMVGSVVEVTTFGTRVLVVGVIGPQFGVPVYDYVATVVSTGSATSYVELSGGPVVSVVTGTRALVTMSGVLGTKAPAISLMSVGVSGATTASPNDQFALRLGAQGPTGMQAPTITSGCSFTFLYPGLTPGENIFTMYARVTSGASGVFAYRWLIVTPLP